MNELFADADIETVFQHAVGAAERGGIAAQCGGVAIAEGLHESLGDGWIAPVVFVGDRDGRVPFLKQMIERVEIIAAEFFRVEAPGIDGIGELRPAITRVFGRAAVERVI